MRASCLPSLTPSSFDRSPHGNCSVRCRRVWHQLQETLIASSLFSDGSWKLCKRPQRSKAKGRQEQQCRKRYASSFQIHTCVASAGLGRWITWRARISAASMHLLHILLSARIPVSGSTPVSVHTCKKTRARIHAYTMSMRECANVRVRPHHTNTQVCAHTYCRCPLHRS